MRNMIYICTFCVTLFVVCAPPCFALGSDGTHKMSVGESKGKCLDQAGVACGCDGGKAKDLTVELIPPNRLSPSGQVEIKVDFTLGDDLDDGFFNASLYFHNEERPFLGYANYFACKDIKPKIPLGHCPLKKGFHLLTTQTVTNLHALTSYPGDYDVEIQVYSKSNGALKEIICFKMYVRIDEM